MASGDCRNSVGSLRDDDGSAEENVTILFRLYNVSEVCHNWTVGSAVEVNTKI